MYELDRALCIEQVKCEVQFVSPNHTSRRVLDYTMTDLEEMSKLQSILLKRLNEYGQSVLDENYDKKKKLMVRSKFSNEQHERTPNSSSTSSSRPESKSNAVRKKRKQRRKETLASSNKDVEENSSRMSDADSSRMSKGEREIMNWRRTLDINPNSVTGSLLVNSSKTKSEESRISPRSRGVESSRYDIGEIYSGSNLHSQYKPSPEVVIYENPAKRKKLITAERVSTTSEGLHSQTGFNLNKARYDVRKLGINGMTEEKKEEAMISLLCSLGAKGPKKKYYNYKEFQEKRKKDIEEINKKKQVERSLGLKTTSRKKGRKRPKDKNDVGNIDGQVGKYRKGVQFVRKHEVKGIK
ncbi:hypothetical protein ScPMuIL_010802 [Solemya velum]